MDDATLADWTIGFFPEKAIIKILSPLSIAMFVIIIIIIINIIENIHFF